MTPPALRPPEDGSLGDPAPSQLRRTPEPQPITGRWMEKLPEEAAGSSPEEEGSSHQTPVPLLCCWEEPRARKGVDLKETGYSSEHFVPSPAPSLAQGRSHRPGGKPLPSPVQAPLGPWVAPPRPALPRDPLPALLPALGTVQGLRKQPLQRARLRLAGFWLPPQPHPQHPQTPQAWHWPLPSTFPRPVHLQASTAQRACISVSNI